MREDTKVTKVFRFEELSEEAQEKAIEKLYDVNVDYEWWDGVYEDAKTIGVRIESFNLDRGSDCRGRFVQDEREVAKAILEEHGKDCETYADAYEFIWELALSEDAFYDNARKEVDEYDGEYDRLSAQEYFDENDECPELLEDFQQTIFEDYRILLQHEYDYLTSAEAIKETIDANEYEFTQDGRIY